MSYKVLYSAATLKTLKKLDRYTAMLITAWIGKNLEGCNDPRIHGKALSANLSGQWRYRVGDYRLLCEINDNTITILVLSIGHRRDIYDS